MPDTELYIIIAVCIAGITAAIVCFCFFIKFLHKKRRQNSEFNKITVGMSESELYALFGEPKKAFKVDSTAKVLTFTEKKWSLLFADTIEAQVAIKNGVVTNVKINV